MSDSRWAVLADVLNRHGDEITREWLRRQQEDLSLRNNLLRPGELEQQCGEFLGAFIAALPHGDAEGLHSPAWAPVRDLVSGISRSRARQGFTPTETAMFVFSLKQPVFDVLRREVKG